MALPLISTVLAFLSAKTAAMSQPSAEVAAPVSIRFITHNIRYNATGLFTNEKPWQIRRPKLVNQLRFNAQHPPEAFICMQEVLHNQLVDIHTDLNAGSTSSSAEWAYIGVGRDDGKEKGEYSPIFYRPAVWSLDSFETVWLSPTPTVPSKGWDAGSIRILTIGVFTHKATARKVVGMCTHLDNAGTVSRLNSAKIITDKINQYTGISSGTKPYLPLVLGGDFNSQPNQEAYLEMSKTTSAVVDVRLSVPEAQRYGNNFTFTDFTDDKKDDTLIDFIWTGPKTESYWTVKTYGVLANKFEDGVYNSDHRAVVTDLILA